MKAQKDLSPGGLDHGLHFKDTGGSVSGGSGTGSSRGSSRGTPRSTAQEVRVVLAGCPNAGKSSLFNAITGSHQKVGNYPGVTVERREGQFSTPRGISVKLVDVPGTYSLDPRSLDEQVAFREIVRSPQGDETQVIVAVADATNLVRTLGLALELRLLGKPLILALNIMDLARKRGLKLDLEALSREMGCPVVETVALSPRGVERLVAAIDDAMAGRNVSPADAVAQPFPQVALESEAMASLLATGKLTQTPEQIRARNAEVDRILSVAVRNPIAQDELTARIDSVVLHPILGLAIFACTIFFMFQAVFSWAEAPMELIETGVGALGESVRALLGEGLVGSLVVDGAIAGVGSVLVFLPQILLLFSFILILEKSGYMARGALLTHRLMSLAGLQGYSFVPLLSSFACAIPGIMAARTIKNPRERMLTIMIAPLMTCSARLPVYVLLIGAFIPAERAVGPFGLQGMVMFLLFVFAIVFGMASAWLLGHSRTGLQTAPSGFVLEMPGYKMPQMRYVMRALWLRAKAFLKRAGSMILLVSVALWVLSTFPRPSEADRAAQPDRTDIEFSLAGRIGAAIEPVFAPLGFDWRISASLIPGFAAREVMVGALGTVFAVEDAEEEGLSALQEKLSATWGIPTGLALLMWYVFAPQCLATFVVMRRESGSRKFTAVSFLYLLAMAYISAFITFQLSSLIF